MKIQAINHSKIFINRISILLAMAVALLTSGCAIVAHIPLASPDKDAEAKRFEPPADKAYIYVMREYRYTGWPNALEVLLNDKDVAYLRNENFALLAVPPGQYKVAVSWVVHNDLGSEFYKKSVSSIELNAKNGKMYFFKTYWVFAGQVGFSAMKKNEGKEEVLRFTRVKEILH
jgi:hypothetical protein